MWVRRGHGTIRSLRKGVLSSAGSPKFLAVDAAQCVAFFDLCESEFKQSSGVLGQSLGFGVSRRGGHTMPASVDNVLTAVVDV